MTDLDALTDALAAISDSDDRGESSIFYDMQGGHYQCQGCGAMARKYTRAVHEPGCLVDALDKAQGLVDG